MRLLTVRAKSPAKAPPRRRSPAWLRLALPPMLIIAIAAASFALWHGRTAQPVVATAEQIFFTESARAGFSVRAVEIEGRHRADPDAVLAALGANRGISIFAVDPEQAKERLEQVPWVRSASVYRRLPDTIFVRMVEQEPLAFWQHDQRLALIDRDGRVIAAADLGAFATLPVLVGEDAPQEGATLIDLMATEPALTPHVTAAVRVGGRRWNLHFDQGVDVALPEEDAAKAWHRLAQIEHDDSIFERDVLSVDLRLPDRVFLHEPPGLIRPPSDKKTAKGGKST
jgi:cell division protein FtsQ